MRKLMRFHTSFLGFFIIAILLPGDVTFAAPNLILKGTVIAPPPCNINNDDLIEINFDENLGVDKIDGVNYRKSISYTIDCADADSHGRLSLTVVGKVMTTDNSAIQSSKSGLGIRLLLDKQRIVIGEARYIDGAKPPKFEAVPVANPKIKLTAGSFVANASLMAEYY